MTDATRHDPRPGRRQRALQLLVYLSCAAGMELRAQTGTVLATVNQLRAPGGVCKAAAPPLIARPQLDAAARAAAQGAPLASALKSAGYRATEAQVISLSGEAVHTRMQALLGSRFCPQIGAARLAEIGVYATRTQLWIVLAAPFAPRLHQTPEQVAKTMLALVNDARATARRCGDKAYPAAPALAWDRVLEAASAQHAQDMAAQDYFSHVGRDGSTPAQRVQRAGYRYRMAGENIAAGQLTPQAAVAGWIKSPGHCANLMNAGFEDMGVAFAVNAQSRMGIYWAQAFGARR